MDRDRETLWTRRSKYLSPHPAYPCQVVANADLVESSSKLSLSMSNSDHHDGKHEHPARTYSSKRFGGDSSHSGRSNPFNAMPPLTSASMASPTAGASTAFGLGSGAFASFGSATKTPKTPGTAFDFGKAASSAVTPTTPSEKREKPMVKPANIARKESQVVTGSEEVNASGAPQLDPSVPQPLKYTWVIWYRPPTSKNSDYEKSTKAMCRMSTVQEFWKVYVHLKHPSTLPTVSDYHFFKEGIRPVWEDDENKKGGKWIMRLKKGVCDRYWENLLLAMIGDQFMEAGEEVCGAVLSVRSGEDVFSIWTKNDGGRNIKIRETIKRVLALPPDTIIVWKSHDDSIAQRSAIDQARQEKAGHHGIEKRRVVSGAEESTPS